VFDNIRRDIEAAMGRDPAARSRLEVLFCYPGVHALAFHRVAHRLWRAGWIVTARFVSHVSRWLTGIEIHPAAKLARGVFIDHGMGVVIGETAEVGAHVTLYHGVTLGGTSLNKEKRHPTLEDNVVVGAGAKILGAITVGESSRIGANAVLVKSVPPNSVVVGVPGQVLARSHPRDGRDAPDLEHNRLPDTIGETLAALVAHVEALEQRLDGHATHQAQAPALHSPEHGVWHGIDFSI
jgi:serine O-acetyltransferase